MNQPGIVGFLSRSFCMKIKYQDVLIVTIRLCPCVFEFFNVLAAHQARLNWDMFELPFHVSGLRLFEARRVIYKRI